MPITRSRAASLTRKEDTPEVFQDPSRPTSPSANFQYGSDAAASSPTLRTDATFSGENVATIIASLQRSQTEAFRDLLESVTRANSTPISVPLGQGNLARCTSTFAGKPQESVEAFIDAVEAYSDCAQVADANIIKGLSFLFKDEAATWWQGIKHSVLRVEEAKNNLISAFGDRRPPHRIYLEIFAKPQKEENTDIFISRIRALLARLPKGDLSVSAQLDITYGLLHSRIRKRIRREEFNNFADLLRLARTIEDSFDEARRPSSGPAIPPPPSSDTAPARVPTVAARAPARPSARPPPPSAPVRQPPASAAPTATQTQESAAVTKKSRPTCVYCKRFGHTRDQCRKLKNQSESQSFNNFAEVHNDNNSASEISSAQNQAFYSLNSRDIQSVSSRFSSKNCSHKSCNSRHNQISSYK
ncbi:activity-regulated cytoskeleton associated protein 1-like [Amyelois transitella]|uniref:activity-regulated cytoskeleton associated protein 1-like n=1 Tax=Amyelois transitella TaxID=680683 RepID=UPI0029906EC0|nr:activity-regulated cytoskeleton associated protein 1-like [Amyelois transitella]